MIKYLFALLFLPMYIMASSWHVADCEDPIPNRKCLVFVNVYDEEEERPYEMHTQRIAIFWENTWIDCEGDDELDRVEFWQYIDDPMNINTLKILTDNSRSKITAHDT